MARVSGESEGGIQAVVLVLRVLDLLAHERREVGVTEIAQSLGTTKSRIYRHLQTLVQEGYIVQPVGSDRYKTGPRLVELGRAASDNLDLISAAADALIDLRNALGHSAALSQVEPDGVRVLMTVPGKSQIEIGVKRGSLLSFHGAAQGKVVLAFSSQEFCTRALRSRLEMLTPYTIVSPAALASEIANAKSQGWATAPNESAVGLNALAAPVFDATGSICGAVGVIDLVQFIDAKPSAEQIRQITDAARRISRELGFIGD